MWGTAIYCAAVLNTITIYGKWNQQTEILLLLFYSIRDFLQSGEFTAAIFSTNSFTISVEYNLLGGDVPVTEKQLNTVSRY